MKCAEDNSSAGLQGWNGGSASWQPPEKGALIFRHCWSVELLSFSRCKASGGILRKGSPHSRLYSCETALLGSGAHPVHRIHLCSQAGESEVCTE